MLWVAALPRLGREAGSRQLDVKGCASSCGVVWGFCIVMVCFSSGCDALCFQGEGYVEVNTWEGKEEKKVSLSWDHRASSYPPAVSKGKN